MGAGGPVPPSPHHSPPRGEGGTVSVRCLSCMVRNQGIRHELKRELAHIINTHTQRHESEPLVVLLGLQPVVS